MITLGLVEDGEDKKQTWWCHGKIYERYLLCDWLASSNLQQIALVSSDTSLSFVAWQPHCLRHSCSYCEAWVKMRLSQNIMTEQNGI